MRTLRFTAALTIVTALVLALAVAACGDSTSDDANPPATSATGQSFNTERDPSYTLDQVAKMAGFESDKTVEELRAEGYEYDIRSWSYQGCDIAVILTSAGEIETYASAGDAVVTNPAGTAGVKFGAEPGCREKLLAALERVE